MLDIKLIREQPDMVKLGVEHKGFNPMLIDELLEVDEQRRNLMADVESKRAEQKKIDYKSESGLAQAKELKAAIEASESQLKELDAKYQEILLSLPNLPAADVAVGEGESANKVIKTVGQKPAITTPLDHVALAEKYDLIDIERAAKVASTRFNFLKNQAVILELGLVRFAFDIALKHDYIPLITPELANQETVMGTGYLPHGGDEVYKTQDDLYLIGTSEQTMIAYHKDEILAEKDLPLRYAGFSSCFRREAGSYGKDTRGILRQHQFDKVELVSLVVPEMAEAEHQRILAIEEEIVQALELPYQVIEMGTGDLGIQAIKKYDIETWMPGQDKYRETHSCSNTTDFQSRRLNIRYKTADGMNRYVYTLNGTAIAIGRILIAILENGQQSDGSIEMPTVLRPYVGFDKIAHA